MVVLEADVTALAVLAASEAERKYVVAQTVVVAVLVAIYYNVCRSYWLNSNQYCLYCISGICIVADSLYCTWQQ